MSRLAPGIALLAVITVTCRADAPSNAEAELRQECDALLAKVVKRPYGWSWPSDLQAESREPVVSLEPLDTPATALVLLHAADVLAEPKYAEAARNAGRLVAASVQASGQISSQIALGPKPLNRERPRPLPDRGSTRSSIALLLSLVQGKEGDLRQDELLTRAAGRGAAWLAKQQAPTGAWPVAYPPEADVKDVTRLIRLDTPDTRDNVLAMLLAYEVLGDPTHRRSVERSIGYLMRVRNGEGQESGAGMYGPAFDAGGGAIARFEEFPENSTDALASRFGIQTEFTAYIILGPREWSQSASVAAKAAGQLRIPEPGKWHRWYSSRGEVIEPESLKAQRGGFAEKPANSLVGDWGLPQALAVVKAHEELGREKFFQRLKEPLSIRQRLALTLCSLLDEPMTVEFPTSVEEARAYLDRLGDAPGKDSEGARHLWRLVLRARIKKQFQL
jgi:hypothetical protein